MSYYDVREPGTGRCYICSSAPGLVSFEREIGKMLGRGEKFFFICYDIDSLPIINNVYDRTTVDKWLLAIADWTHIFPNASVYRLGGDLFCMLLKNSDIHEAEQTAVRLYERFMQPWNIDSHTLYVNANVSIVPPDDDILSQSLPDLFARSLEASRCSKRPSVFDSYAYHKSREHLSMVLDLKNCILTGMRGFSVHFQPIADPHTGVWKGLEALCRWHRPGYGPVPPCQFIPEAEDMGLIHVLGRWVLEKSLQTCKAMQLDRLDGFFLSVNVSSSQIMKYGFAEQVLSALSLYSYPHSKLLLEITESTEFVFNDITNNAITTLKNTGITFALDDFGTGYSGFNSLKNLPVDILKTEREFIMGIENDAKIQYFYLIMSETAHDNNMKLIAEGVETEEQLHCVVNNGADYVQGYHIGKPMSEDDIRKHTACFSYPSFNEQVGKPKYDFVSWVLSHDKHHLTPSLFLLLNRCIKSLLNTNPPECAVYRILGNIGRHFGVQRAFVFLRDDKDIFSEKFEWLSDGTEGLQDCFQQVDCSKDFIHNMYENELFVASGIHDLPDPLRARIENDARAASIQSVVLMPLEQKGRIAGFAGYDDCRKRVWTAEEMLLLNNLCLLVLIALRPTNNSEIKNILQVAKQLPEKGSYQFFSKKKHITKV